MAKRSRSVVSITEQELTRLIQENGTRILSELGNHRINETLVKQAQEKPLVKADFSMHRLNHLIGIPEGVKVNESSPTFRNRIVTLLELQRHYSGSVTYALVRDRKGEEKLVEDQWIEERKAHKHGAKPRWEDGFYFRSGGEADRYLFLKQMQEMGQISDLKVGPKFLLQEAFVYRDMKFQTQYYTADFQYTRNGLVWVEDWKTKQKKGKGRKGNYVANTTTIARFLKIYPETNFTFATEQRFLP